MARPPSLILLDYEKLLALWGSEILKCEMIAALGTTRHGLEKAKADLQLPNRPGRKSWHCPHTGKRKYARMGDGSELTEEEVRHRTAKVQATWTDEVFAMRSKGQFRHTPFCYETYSLRMLSLRG